MSYCRYASFCSYIRQGFRGDSLDSFITEIIATLGRGSGKGIELLQDVGRSDLTLYLKVEDDAIVLKCISIF